MPPRQAKLPDAITVRYDVGNEIGRGAYGIVYSAMTKQNGRPVALKSCKKVLVNKTDAHRTLREVKRLQLSPVLNQPAC